MRWIIGLVLFVSLALNFGLAGYLVAGHVAQNVRPMAVVMKRMAKLPEPERGRAEAIFDEARPRLEAALWDIRRTRRDIADYVKSEGYDRAEAEKRFAALRQKTSAVQAMAQQLMLDIADQLTPEQRAALLKRRPGLFR